MSRKTKSIVIFSCTLGIMLTLSVLIGDIAWRFKLGLSVFKTISSAYSMHASVQTTWFRVIIGSAWAFLDGFLLGVIFMQLYYKIHHLVDKKGF